jgi:hypothetical protein
MTELKTLKDIHRISKDLVVPKELENELSDEFVSKYELRQEAIKRAKENMRMLWDECKIKMCDFNRVNCSWEKQIDSDMNKGGYYIGKIEECIEFFNITEEELK